MTAKGDILPKKLPPTPWAGYYHSVKSTSASRDMGINGRNKSWSIGVGLETQWKLLVPIMTDLDPASSQLLQFVRCNCKTENRRPSTSICFCRKHRLKCVSSCGACRAKSCENNDVRDLNFISHFYKGLKRSKRMISLYGSRTIAP